VVYEHTAQLARTQIHRKVGTVLERERAAGAPVAAAELAMHFERGHEPMTALRYYVEAAEAALLHLSPAECMSLTDHGLTLLDLAQEGMERDALEIALATLYGVSAAHLLGVSSSEAKAAFERAHALLREVPQHRMRALVLHGFGFVLCQRAEYAEALAMVERSGALSSATKDPVLLLAACTVQGEVQMLRGRPRIARDWIERGLAAIDSVDTEPEQSFVADPKATLLALLAIPLLHLGLVATARTRLREAHARARQVRQPMAQLVAIWLDALFELRLGNVERVAALADEMQALVDEFALAQGRTACRWFRAWADARLGDPRDACRRIREACEENTRLGMLAGRSETLGYAAEALMLAADWDAAQHQLQEALEIASTQDERVYLPQLFLIEAAIARGRGQPDVALDAVRRAVTEARAQEAPWLELTALVVLCEGERATGEDRRALAALVDRLPEAIGTSAFMRAQAALAKIKPS
jgi:tetratricopeptide (TPR) repeat protein